MKRKNENHEGSVSEEVEKISPNVDEVKINAIRNDDQNTVELVMGEEEKVDEEDQGEFINLDDEDAVEKEEELADDGELIIEPLKPALVAVDGEVPMEVEAIVNEEMILEGSEELIHAQGDYDPTLDLPSYKYPTLDLLASSSSLFTSIFLSP